MKAIKILNILVITILSLTTVNASLSVTSSNTTTNNEGSTTKIQNLNNEQKACTREFTPVCWITSDGNKKTYSNKCAMENAEAKFQYRGKCKTNNKKPNYTGGSQNV